LSQNRKPEDVDQVSLARSAMAVLNAEAIHCAEAAAPNVAKPEEKVSVFWRVFGGTLLSIAALVVLTVYQQVSSGLADLRTNVNHLHETSADLLKKEEFNARATTIWTTINQFKDEAPAQKTRLTQLEVEVRALQEERKELINQIQALRERMAALEGRQGGSKTGTTINRVEGGID
jgi:septal ring factor EnvC (AmiA/AmiB activator)